MVFAMKINEILNTSEIEFKKSRVLVTGSSGYVGRTLCKYLLSMGCDVLGIDKYPDNSLINEHGFNLIEMERLKKVIDDYMPKIVFHTGTNSALHYKNNFQISFNEDYNSITNLIATISVETKVVFYSSSYVYSGASYGAPLCETQVASPNHNFGVGKLFLEQYLLRLHKNTVIFRMSSVFGEGKPRSPNAIKSLIDESIDAGTITIWGDGSRKMQYVCMDDVVGSSILVPKINPGIFNLASRDYLTVNDVSEEISRHFSSRVIHSLDKVSGETLPALSVDKLEGEVSLSPSPVLESLINFLKSEY